MIRFESGDSNHLAPALTGNAGAYAPNFAEPRANRISD
jgi:hypothetical protein